MGDVLKSAYFRAKAVEYLHRFIGLPYVFGGDDPIAGFDCSGLMVEILQAIGLIKHGSDYSAAMLYKKFEDEAVEKGYAGCLVFWYRDDEIIHVEMMIDDFHVVGASGGGSSTTTLEAAIDRNAFIKMRPLSYRGPDYLISDPFKTEEK